MDAIAEWERSFAAQPPILSPGSQSSCESFSLLTTPAPPSSDDWTWEVPDLSDGSPWYKARVASLQQAVSDLKDGELHLLDGLEALRVHRDNYSDAGPKKLQILWWEFPSEHWQALREGSRMNFLIKPSGELKLNAVMDDESKVAAGIFVDELKRLGVLIPATEELKANCPLFCVDKPHQPGNK
jgi:hypothetical protein